MKIERRNDLSLRLLEVFGAVMQHQTTVRSAEALAVIKKAGFTDAMHLQGGIVAWAKQLEPDMVMY